MTGDADKPGKGDRWFARVDVHGHAGSAETLAADLPAAWDITVGNRSLTIVIPCPPVASSRIVVVSSMFSRMCIRAV